MQWKYMRKKMTHKRGIWYIENINDDDVIVYKFDKFEDT